jgi:hypothetical protein
MRTWVEDRGKLGVNKDMGRVVANTSSLFVREGLIIHAFKQAVGFDFVRNNGSCMTPRAGSGEGDMGQMQLLQRRFISAVVTRRI